jgi:hypothetical protein
MTRRIGRACTFAVLLTAAILQGSCGGGPPSNGPNVYEDPKAPIGVNPGDEFEIALPTGGFMGLTWNWTLPADNHVVEYQSSRADEVPCCDFMTTTYFIFRAAQSGSVDITFEPNHTVGDIATRTFSVTVD